MRPPRYSCKIGSRADGFELGAYRDKLGNVSFAVWKSGIGFIDQDEVKTNIKQLKKLRDWLTKIIDYVERP